jgi:hypothetical protein
VEGWLRGRVDGDLGEADRHALTVGGLQHGGAVLVDRERVERAAVEENGGASSAATSPSTERVALSTEAPGSVAKSVRSTLLPPAATLRPLPS